MASTTRMVHLVFESGRVKRSRPFQKVITARSIYLGRFLDGSETNGASGSTDAAVVASRRSR
jgi:hypothetical protein